MASMRGLRTGLEARLATISGLRTADTLPGQVPVPCAVVFAGRPPIEYDSTYQRGADVWNLVIRIYVSEAADRAAQERLDGYLAKTGAGSVKAAVQADKTLGGEAMSARVTRVESYGPVEHNGVVYLAADLLVECIA